MEVKEVNVIGVLLKMTDGEHAGSFVLQKRSPLNKGFHYICQETWAGKMEEGETPMEAVKRECSEELGEAFYRAFDFSTISFIGKKLNEIDGKKYLIHSYVGNITQEMVGKAVLHQEALPEFLYVNKDSVFFPMSAGQDPKEHIVVFEDQYKVLKELINHGD